MNVTVNGQEQSVKAGITIAELLRLLQVPQRGVAVEVNEEIVPRLRHAEHTLAEGDRLEVVSLVGGG